LDRARKRSVKGLSARAERFSFLLDGARGVGLNLRDLLGVARALFGYPLRVTRFPEKIE